MYFPVENRQWILLSKCLSSEFVEALTLLTDGSCRSNFKKSIWIPGKFSL